MKRLKRVSITLLWTAVACLLCLSVVDEQIWLVGREQGVRELTARTSEESNTFLSEDGICLNKRDRYTATLHHPTPGIHNQYRGYMASLIRNKVKTIDRPLPKIRPVKDGRYGVWFPNRNFKASAWNNYGYMAQGPGWMPPPPVADESHCTRRVLEGEYMAFSTWFVGHWGHTMHDFLPTLAYLRSMVNDDVKFLLVDHGAAKSILRQVDPDFYDRVEWIQVRECISIDGTLLITHVDRIPYGMGGKLMNYLREWMSEAHPEVPEEKTIVYYKREANGDTQHARIMDPENEKEVLRHIEAALHRHGRTEQITIFTGQVNGSTMPIQDQYDLFRSASAIIGPHGSGLSGNFIWTNPRPVGCANRVKVLEFITAPFSRRVHGRGPGVPFSNLYWVFRGWPFDYHHILFEPQSSKRATFVNLDHLDEALDAMFSPSSASES